MAASDPKRPRRDQTKEDRTLSKDDFRKLEIDINNELNNHQLDTLKYLCLDESIGLGFGELSACKTGLDLFGKLEQRKLLSNEDLELLVELIDLLRLPKLKTKVEECATVEKKRIISRYRRMVLACSYEISDKELDYLKGATLLEKLASGKMAELDHPIRMMYTLEKHGHIAPEKVEYLLTIFEHLDRPVVAAVVLRYQEEFLIGRYTMNSKSRGVCIIINNIDFSKSKRTHEERKGSEKDQEKLKEIFKKLGFTVREETNLTAERMSNVIQEASKKDHSAYDCFVCCILSHGNAEVVTGVDGKPCRIMDIARHMRTSNCPSLANKPKMFFVQACQGKTKEDRVDLNPSFNDDPREESQFINENADFLFGYASFPGTKANLNMASGSTYINKLTEVLDKHHKDLDILSMLTLVNKEVCKEDLTGPDSKHGVVYGQTPSPKFTLTKKLYFN